MQTQFHQPPPRTLQCGECIGFFIDAPDRPPKASTPRLPSFFNGIPKHSYAPLRSDSRRSAPLTMGLRSSPPLDPAGQACVGYATVRGAFLPSGAGMSAYGLWTFLSGHAKSEMDILIPLFDTACGSEPPKGSGPQVFYAASRQGAIRESPLRSNPR